MGFSQFANHNLTVMADQLVGLGHNNSGGELKLRASEPHHHVNDIMRDIIHPHSYFSYLTKCRGQLSLLSLTIRL